MWTKFACSKRRASFHHANHNSGGSGPPREHGQLTLIAARTPPFQCPALFHSSHVCWATKRSSIGCTGERRKTKILVSLLMKLPFPLPGVSSHPRNPVIKTSEALLFQKLCAFTSLPFLSLPLLQFIIMLILVSDLLMSTASSSPN